MTGAFIIGASRTLRQTQTYSARMLLIAQYCSPSM
jgi:ribosomal protein L30E